MTFYVDGPISLLFFFTVTDVQMYVRCFCSKFQIFFRAFQHLLVSEAKQKDKEM